ncbi:uncharacterized protein wu:fa56d06 isoform X1 [Astyanax mexicanus]|uniref:uncharacterized protein wu:fa56d06 isoform X1 n=1 Tax=Astyanax mexicanus TaxID=7994 RepID=UPI0020CB69F1|nr:uncharacterized protein wu:fa56d06 isoform X1 [Astyanax mexicanus]
MLRTVLLLIALSGLQARPLPNDLLRFQNGGWVIGAPQLVQDQLMDNFVYSESNAQSRRSPTDLNNGLIKKQSSVINSESKEKVAVAPAVEVKVQDNPIQKAFGAENRRQGTEPSRRFLVDLNTGLLKEHVSEMDRRVSGFYNYPSNREFRQGTEPSRRFLVDLRTGLLKSHVSEMNRRVSGFSPYNSPSRQEFRQGTENSRRTLVDIRTGLQLAHLTEMQRSTSPLDEFRQGTEYSPAALLQLRAELMENMERDKFTEDQSKGKDSAHHRASPPEIRRQGTEPSRRFLIDPNTGMLKEHVSEMDRRVSGFYNYPSNYEFRQGTENSQATLVDIRSGHLLAPLSEMQRTVALLSDQGSMEHSPDISPELHSNHLVENIGANEVHIPDFRQAENMEPQKALEHNEVMEELMHGMEYSHANIIDNHIMESAEMKKIDDDGVTMCQGEEIDGKCYYFNSNLLTFSEAETSCKTFSSLGHLASVTSSGLHVRLVELVTRAKGEGVLTWLGGIMRDAQFEWTDGSSWEYSDWMPGHPSTEKYEQSCMEMFRMGESWWTAADCDLKRASVCSYPVRAL